MQLSIIVPVHYEEESILAFINKLQSEPEMAYEMLIIYDSINDPTVNIVKRYFSKEPCIRLIQNKLGPGPANAIKTGILSAKGEAVVVVMADLSDDISQINHMYRLINKGNDIVCASRYMKEGQKIGGPFIKSILSRLACLSLYHLGLPTHDATNAFKMYKRLLLEQLNINSRHGFEISMEIVIRAHKLGYKIVEIPTIWKERKNGKSKFRLGSWLLPYLKQYLIIFGTQKHIRHH